MISYAAALLVIGTILFLIWSNWDWNGPSGEEDDPPGGLPPDPPQPPPTGGGGGQRPKIVFGSMEAIAQDALREIEDHDREPDERETLPLCGACDPCFCNPTISNLL